jgi:hypothetical protein
MFVKIARKIIGARGLLDSIPVYPNGNQHIFVMQNKVYMCTVDI